MSKSKTKDWFSYDRLLGYHCKYNVAFGLRRNGKTFDAKKKIVEVVKNGGYFTYIRRKHKHITRSKMVDLFADMEEYVIQEIGSFIFYDPNLGFYIEQEDEAKKVVGNAASIEFAMDYKGVTYKSDIVFFDEFIDYSYYDDEIKRFLNLIKTITSNRDDVTILMAANSIAKRCPYFELFGVDIQNFKKGNIATIKHNNGATVAIEYCKPRVDVLGKEKKDPYIGFDNNGTVNMIMHGDWEYDEFLTRYIDGIGWNTERYLIPVYFNSLGKVYELTMKRDTNYPIGFVRTINTQNGVVRKEIKYSIVNSESMQLQYANGEILPSFRTWKSKFFDDMTQELMDTFNECMKTGRVLFDNVETGTEFSAIYAKCSK